MYYKIKNLQYKHKAQYNPGSESLLPSSNKFGSFSAIKSSLQ